MLIQQDLGPRTLRGSHFLSILVSEHSRFQNSVIWPPKGDTRTSTSGAGSKSLQGISRALSGEIRNDLLKGGVGSKKCGTLYSSAVSSAQICSFHEMQRGSESTQNPQPPVQREPLGHILILRGIRGTQIKSSHLKYTPKPALLGRVREKVEDLGGFFCTSALQ